MHFFFFHFSKIKIFFGKKSLLEPLFKKMATRGRRDFETSNSGLGFFAETNLH